MSETRERKLACPCALVGFALKMDEVARAAIDGEKEGWTKAFMSFDDLDVRGSEVLLFCGLDMTPYMERLETALKKGDSLEVAKAVGGTWRELCKREKVSR